MAETTTHKFRRLINPPPCPAVTEIMAIPTASPSGSRYESDWMSVGMGELAQFWRCPYGLPGDDYAGFCVVDVAAVYEGFHWWWVANVRTKQTPGGA
jgi:hypothetical protein